MSSPQTSEMPGWETTMKYQHERMIVNKKARTNIVKEIWVET